VNDVFDVVTLRSYNSRMKFEWDEVKNQTNIRKHGLDFKDAPQIFDGPMLVDLDPRQEYEEERWIGIGLLRNRVVVVVYIERHDEETIRIISLRKALSYEHKRFEECI